MAFWGRVKRALSRQPPEPPAPAPPSSSMLPEEAFLRGVLDALTAPSATARAAPPVDSPEVRTAVERLALGGHERTAIELVRRLLVLRPDEHALAARLVELLCDRLEHAAAVPYLEHLLAVPAYAARARFLLAEAAERAGALDEARRHYELLLAVDIDYPKARARHARLTPERRAVADGAPTVAGVAGAAASVGERYRLRRELGRGASGAVYLALDDELDREVALKLLHPRALASAEGRVRSFNEARIAAALRHPGVVAIYDLDEERGLIAMELCPGGTLRDRLARGRLAPDEALARAGELLATLEMVHAAGIVHRDLKPGNLLFRQTPAVLGDGDELVLGDFGLAHLRDGGAGESAPAGTLGYLAPEARRGEISPAADVWAAGVLLHEMLTGAAPFDRAAVLRGEVRYDAALPDPVATALGPAAAAAVTALVARLLDADPAARPTAAAARQLLAAIR